MNVAAVVSETAEKLNVSDETSVLIVQSFVLRVAPTETLANAV